MIKNNNLDAAVEVVYITEEDVIEASLRNNRYADRYREMLSDERIWRGQVRSAIDALNRGTLTL